MITKHLKSMLDTILGWLIGRYQRSYRLERNAPALSAGRPNQLILCRSESLISVLFATAYSKVTFVPDPSHQLKPWETWLLEKLGYTICPTEKFLALPKSRQSRACLVELGASTNETLLTAALSHPFDEIHAADAIAFDRSRLPFTNITTPSFGTRIVCVFRRVKSSPSITSETIGDTLRKARIDCEAVLADRESISQNFRSPEIKIS